MTHTHTRRLSHQTGAVTRTQRGSHGSKEERRQDRFVCFRYTEYCFFLLGITGVEEVVVFVETLNTTTRHTHTHTTATLGTHGAITFSDDEADIERKKSQDVCTDARYSNGIDE